MKKMISMLLVLAMLVSVLPLSALAAETGLVLHYEMTEQTAADSAGDFDGTLVGSASWVSGLNGYAVQLAGGEDYIRIPNAALTQAEDVSVSMWVRLDKTANWTALLVVGNSSSNYAVLASQGTPYGTACGLTMEINENAANKNRVKADAGVSPAAGEWSHVVYTQSGTTATLYLNGAQVAQIADMPGNIKGVLDASADADVRIGDNRMFADPSLAGAVGEVKIYSRAITAEEVKAAYDAKSDLTAETELQTAADSVDLGDLSEVIDDLTLVTQTENGVKVAWKSSNENFVTNDGKVTLPTEAQGDQQITLTATFSSDKTDKTISKEFKFTLTPMTDGKMAKKGAAFVQRYVDYLLNDGYELLTGARMDELLGTDYGCQIEWELTSGEAEIRDGKICKTEASAERQAIQLKATVTKGDASETVEFKNVTLMDEYVGYILSFFGGDDGTEKLHLAYSSDGINWNKLNDGLSVLPTTIGNGNVRDPFILRKKDGSFAVVATQGWDTPQIYLWDSEDLVTYTNERLKTVTREGVVGLTGARAWAPEASYDPINDEYIIYWADPRANGGDNGVCYANTSDDLENFSDPFILFDPGYKMIDANIIKWQGTYYMAYKDGTDIKMAKSDSLEPGSFRQYTGAITETLVEGPFIFKDIHEEKWYHYYDYYNEHKFGVSVTTDLASGQWEFLGKSQTMPTEDVRHGGVVPVTQKEMNRILVGYGVLPAEPVPGDVNDDGKINVVDILCLKTVILSGNPTDRQLVSGDLDGDGSLTVTDMMELKAEILKG